MVVRWTPSFGCRALGEERTNAHSGFFIGGTMAENDGRWQLLETRQSRSLAMQDDADAMGGAAHAVAPDYPVNKVALGTVACNVIAAQAC